MKHKNKNTKHKLKIGTCTKFKHAGRFRVGVVTELTWDASGEATYTVCTSGDNGRVYPRLGTDGSKWMGWVDTRKK